MKLNVFKNLPQMVIGFYETICRQYQEESDNSFEVPKVAKKHVLWLTENEVN